ncbi:universal stress protein [Cohnella sp.]|uniref:universal stress protein n=1 Tax=Cohnella sp. TaxID=1883426 RepID=UPI00356815BE
MLFSHILVPYDGSNPAGKALRKAVELAKIEAGIHLTVAHVINLQPFIMGEMAFSQPESYQEQLNEQGKEVLNRIKSTIEVIPDANVVILAGSPAEAIVDYALNNSCDLIMMGSRGLSSMREWMVGSVSHNVIQHSHIPVMIFK